MLHVDMTNAIHLFASEEIKSTDAEITMYILSHDAHLTVGDQYEIDVVLTNDNQLLLNASESEIRFDPDKIKVTDVQFHTDLCKHELVIERKVDNDTGHIQLSCGTYEPFSGPAAVLATLVITPIAQGSTSLYFGERSNVYRHDGLGTQVSGPLYGQDYELASA